MQKKLTLRLDDELIKRAKAYSRKRGKSLSQLVDDYLAKLVEPPELRREELDPLTKSLLGALSGYEVSERDYYEYLEKKYLD